MFDVRARLMRCCKSQNREHKREGDSGYGQDHCVVVRKKHGLHVSLHTLSSRQWYGQSYGTLRRDAYSNCLLIHRANSGTPYVFLNRQNWHRTDSNVQSESGITGLDVRFGSKADMCSAQAEDAPARSDELWQQLFGVCHVGRRQVERAASGS